MPHAQSACTLGQKLLTVESCHQPDPYHWQDWKCHMHHMASMDPLPQRLCILHSSKAACVLLHQFSCSMNTLRTSGSISTPAGPSPTLSICHGTHGADPRGSVSSGLVPSVAAAAACCCPRSCFNMFCATCSAAAASPQHMFPAWSRQQGSTSKQGWT